MRLTTALLVVAAVALADRAPAQTQWHAGVIGGAQLLQSKNTDLSHGALRSEVTFGRTFLGGLAFGAVLRERHVIAAELVAGPYHDDRDRSCINSGIQLDCELRDGLRTDFALHYGLHYSYLFRSTRPSLYLGIGVGAKTYDYDDEDLAYDVSQSKTALALHGALGVELGGRRPLRLEVRGIAVPGNPYLEQDEDATNIQWELQVRLALRLPFGS